MPSASGGSPSRSFAAAPRPPDQTRSHLSLSLTCVVCASACAHAKLTAPMVGVARRTCGAMLVFRLVLTGLVCFFSFFLIDEFDDPAIVYFGKGNKMSTLLLRMYSIPSVVIFRKEKGVSTFNDKFH